MSFIPDEVKVEERCRPIINKSVNYDVLVFEVQRRIDCIGFNNTEKKIAELYFLYGCKISVITKECCYSERQVCRIIKKIKKRVKCYEQMESI